MRLPISPADAVWGSAVAPVTLVEFTDLQCPFCARAEATLAELKREYGPENLRIVVKHFAFHERSEALSRLSQAVLGLGGSKAFFAFTALVYAHQDEAADRDFALSLVRRSGVDPAQAEAIAASPTVEQKLAADADLVRALELKGTPTFFVNGTELGGARPLEEFRVLIEGELAAAKELVAEGTLPRLVYPTRVGVNAAEAARLRAAAESRVAEHASPAHDETVWKVPIAGAPQRGPSDAPVTVVEFSDYECPYSRRVQDTVDRLFELYPGKLRWSRRENPLSFHRRALPAAQFALEARAQRGDAIYFEAARLLFLSGLEPAHLTDIGKELGLDMARLSRAMTKGKHRAKIERDQDLAAELGATATPFFFVNGRRLSGAQPLGRFRELIDAELTRAAELVERGVPPARLYATIMKDAKPPEPPSRLDLPPPADDLPSRGPRAAPVVIEVFGDLECAFSARSAATLDEVEQAFPGKVRFVWRHLPLESIHPRARAAARAAEEARAQKGDGAFWTIVARFYRDREAEDAFSDARLSAYARELGLSADALLAATRDGRHDALIDRDLALAAQAGITATPTFSVNGHPLTGAQPLSAFRRLVRYSLAHPKRGAPRAAR